MTRVARWVSIAAHPFVTALVLTGAVELHRGWPAALRTVAAVGILFVVPLALLIARQRRSGAWHNVDASRPHERPIMFAVGAGGVLALVGWFATMRPDSPLARAAVVVLLMLAACAAATRWVKVSLHVVAASLGAAVLLARGLPLGWPFALLVPVLGWSRVALGRHRWVEVAAGAAIGAVTGAVIARIA